jgi:hypothetical protein
MQKNYIISCCAECPAFIRKDNSCEKEELIIEQDTSNPVDLIFTGFPKWCPLPDIEIIGDNLSVEFKKIARQVLKRIDFDFDDDSVSSIAHYLSTVVDIKDFKDAKEKTKSNDLFGLSAS